MLLISSTIQNFTMKAQSFHVTSVEELYEKLNGIIASKFKPTVAIVFASVKYDFKKIIHIFDKHQIDLIGCSSAGEIERMDITEEEIVVMVMDMNKDNYSLCKENANNNTTYQVAHSIGQHAKNKFENPAVIVFSGGMNTDADQIIFGIKDGVQKEIPIYGGLAGDDLILEETFVFTNNWISTNGLLALVIDRDKVQVKGRAISGWESVGLINTVTKAQGNVLYEINGEPALDVFIKYFGFYNNRKSGKLELETISGQYPLQIQRNGGYTVLRSPLVANEKERSLILAGGIKEGEQFKFSIAPNFEVVDQAVEEYKALKQECGEVDAIIMVSCKGRHTAFGPMMEIELEGINKQWNVPLVGFFSYGEIGNVKNGTCEFHNVSSSLVTLKEL